MADIPSTRKDMEAMRLVKEDLAVARETSASSRLLMEQFSELRETYPNQYVAVLGGEVVFSSEDLDEVIAKVRRLARDRNVPENRFLVEFIPEADAIIAD